MSSPSLPPPVRRRTALLAVLATLGLGAATAPTAGAALYGTQGIPAGVEVPAATTDRALDHAERSGARLVRIQADWSAVEPRAQGERDAAAVAALDRVVDGVARRGMRTLLVLSRTPCWASAAPAELRGDCSGPEASRAEVSRYRPAKAGTIVPVGRFLAARYADRLAAFQVWNEPDQVNEKYWAGPGKAKAYVAMVKQLYPALKAVAPEVPVIVGSFVGTNGKWLQAMYDEGIRGFYDGLAVQFYRFTLYGLRNTRAVQRRNGDRKQLWLTEFGYTTCYRRGGPPVQIDQPCTSRAVASRATADVISGVRSRSWIAAVVQFAVLDDGPGGYTFGLFDAQGKAKPTLTGVQNALSGATPRPKRPVLRLRGSRGRLVVSGTASVTELLTVRVEQRGVLRYRATLGADRLGRYRVVLPAALGTRGLTVRLSAGWAGRATRRI